MWRPAWAVPALVALALAPACDSDSGHPATVTSSATTASPPQTPTPAPSLPSGPTEVRTTVQLVDVRSRTVTTLVEEPDVGVWDAWFEGGEVLVGFVGRGDYHRFALDGATLPPRPATNCPDPEGGAAGGGYANSRCPGVSPDGRWLAYREMTGTVTHPSGFQVPVEAQWVLDLKSGERKLLQEGLVHCGGCGGMFGYSWSPTSRYLVYAEYGLEQRRFISDVANGATRQIGYGAYIEPAWSPSRDLLVYGDSPGGPSIIEDLSMGMSQQLGLAWPVSFDPTGTLLYSPRWSSTDPLEHTQTTIADASGSILETLAGGPVWYGWVGRAQVVHAATGVVAALVGAPGCEGVIVYRAGSAQCVPAGAEGQVSATGDVAVAVQTGQTGPVRGPGFDGGTIGVFAIEVVAKTGDRWVAIKDALNLQAPIMVWNDAGTHLLVLWPFVGGE